MRVAEARFRTGTTDGARAGAGAGACDIASATSGEWEAGMARAGATAGGLSQC